jgi:hypothetical protein
LKTWIFIYNLDFEIPVCNNSIIQNECLSGSILFALFIGSPFKIPVGEPPDPRKVHIYGPGIEDGLLQLCFYTFSLIPGTNSYNFCQSLEKHV